ncbi:DUF3857 domain-containing protein [Pedobacter sp. HMF7647]|uniref:DUF3857 domain-containing protein n=1 Tax=Hufsiella arboris TaxID=2695275 RepID=A0A7K1YBX2_9SPHI|nr:DUF3857 domain-containing protein [Hufsiella arboris]MXV52086.1 DUF3857 domain-containing protein [Hufsiella arboris]
MKKISLFIALLCLFKAADGQDFAYGSTTLQELDMKSYSRDTSANAVVLKEFGTARISSDDKCPLIFDYHVKIKIFNSKAFEYGDVVIPVYKSNNDRYELVREIKGVTTYLGKDGAMHTSELDPKKVFRENKNIHWDLLKFAMPNLTDGCIVEYSYEIESPYVFNFRKWDFQWNIPKMSSEYVAHIPAVYNYNASLKGYLKLTKNDAELEKECFAPGGGVKADCSKISYLITDVPAFVEEDYMTSSVNFKSSINYELSDYVDYMGAKHKVTKDWKDVDYELKQDENFGSQLKKKDFFKPLLTASIQNQPDELSKAKAVYSFIKRSFKWNNRFGCYSENGIKKAFESHTGNIGDINLSLIAALSSAGINTEAVLLSTRDNGLINRLFPVISDFNYVVAKATIGGKSYMLDASDPLLSFGLLPVRCINDQGRVLSLDKASYWVDLTASQKENKIYNLNLELKNNGKIEGDMTIMSFGYEAYNKRKAIKKFNSEEEYLEDLDEKMPKIKLLKSEIKNVDSLDIGVVENYHIEIDAYSSLNQQFSFNPFFMDPVKENPFKLKERNYPVDWGVPSESKISINLTFPKEYEIVSKPADVGLALPEGGGRFITSITTDQNSLNYSELFALNKSVYMSDEYPFLKELFNRIIQTQKSDIIFKKK